MVARLVMLSESATEVLKPQILRQRPQTKGRSATNRAVDDSRTYQKGHLVPNGCVKEYTLFRMAARTTKMPREKTPTRGIFFLHGKCIPQKSGAVTPSIMRSVTRLKVAFVIKWLVAALHWELLGGMAQYCEKGRHQTPRYREVMTKYNSTTTARRARMALCCQRRVVLKGGKVGRCERACSRSQMRGRYLQAQIENQNGNFGQPDGGILTILQQQYQFASIDAVLSI